MDLVYGYIGRCYERPSARQTKVNAQSCSYLFSLGRALKYDQTKPCEYCEISELKLHCSLARVCGPMTGAKLHGILKCAKLITMKLSIYSYPPHTPPPTAANASTSYVRTKSPNLDLIIHNTRELLHHVLY